MRPGSVCSRDRRDRNVALGRDQEWLDLDHTFHAGNLGQVLRGEGPVMTQVREHDAALVAVALRELARQRVVPRCESVFGRRPDVAVSPAIADPPAIAMNNAAIQSPSTRRRCRYDNRPMRVNIKVPPGGEDLRDGETAVELTTIGVSRSRQSTTHSTIRFRGTHRNRGCPLPHCQEHVTDVTLDTRSRELAAVSVVSVHRVRRERERQPTRGTAVAGRAGESVELFEPAAGERRRPVQMQPEDRRVVRRRTRKARESEAQVRRSRSQRSARIAGDVHSSTCLPERCLQRRVQRLVGCKPMCCRSESV